MDYKIRQFLNSLYLVVRNWVFQSYLYVERTELLFKLFFEFAVFLALLPLFSIYLSGKRLIVAVAVVAHTISWSFNGDIHVLRKSIGLSSTQSVSSKLAHLESVCQRASENSSMKAVGIVGSVARGEMSSTSDIDLRIIRKPGVKAAIGASLFLLRERIKSLYSGMPFDCYLYDDIEAFEKDAESPVIFEFNHQSADIKEQFQILEDRNL